MVRLVNKDQADTEIKQAVHIINIDIKDDYENAVIGGKGILKLVNMIHEFRNTNKQRRLDHDFDDESDTILEDQMMKLLAKWQQEHTHLPTLYSVAYY